MMKSALVAVLLSLLAGCATYTTTSIGGRTTVAIQNTGWYLFNFIPLGSGDHDNPNHCSCNLFQNSVSLESNMTILKKAMVSEKAYKAENVASRWTDERVFFILLKRYACHTSAELIK